MDNSPSSSLVSSNLVIIFNSINIYYCVALPYIKGNRKELQKKSLPHNIGNPKKGPNIMISKDSKKEYFNEILDRCWLTTSAGTIAILNEFCRVCNYNRKYPVRLLNTSPNKKQFDVKAKAGRPPQYNDSDMLEFLLKLWKATNLACSKRLKTMIPNWLPHYEQYFNLELSSETKKLLLKISHSTIDRYLKPYRKRYKKAGLSTTKPGSLLKKHIPIKTNQRDETVPGFLEADTVAFQINGQHFTALNGGPVFKFNEAVSFQVFCETQEEIDYYWDKLSKDGTEGQCGWLQDKFGLSWQIIPSILNKLLTDPIKAGKVTKAFLQMKKFDIEKIKQA